VQSAGFALFYGIGNCSYSSGIPTRIALAILGVQSAGFALFYLGKDSNIKIVLENAIIFLAYQVMLSYNKPSVQICFWADCIRKKSIRDIVLKSQYCIKKKS